MDFQKESLCIRKHKLEEVRENGRVTDHPDGIFGADEKIIY